MLTNSQKSRIDHAHARAREILKFSPLITDAYFHFTPSQIMFAALSMADQGLVELVMDEAFKTGGESGVAGEQTSEAKAKVMRTIESCQSMLETEPPERMTDYWGSVRMRSRSYLGERGQPANARQAECAKMLRPLLRKLKKCRDPDREDLVALQRARKELALAREEKASKKGSTGDDGAVFGGPSGADARDSKRRKHNPSADDVFGPAL
jgi:cyclin H